MPQRNRVRSLVLVSEQGTKTHDGFVHPGFEDQHAKGVETAQRASHGDQMRDQRAVRKSQRCQRQQNTHRHNDTCLTSAPLGHIEVIA